MPAFNEEQSIADVVASVQAVIPDGEILVVDDGSTDATAARAEAAGARVVRHPYNIGNGAAVKTGLRSARHNTVVLMDADGQHNPSDIPALLKESQNCDMVVGARSSETHAGLLRRIANAVYNMLARFITLVDVKDLTSGFRVVKRDIALRYVYLFPNSFSYPTTITLAYLRSGRSVVYVPVHARRRTGSSKIRLFHDGMRFLLIIVKIATLYSPLHIFLPISFVFFLLGIGYYSYTFAAMHRFTNMSALLLISSVIVFMMGLISEQITQLRYDRIENGG